MSEPFPSRQQKEISVLENKFYSADTIILHKDAATKWAIDSVLYLKPWYKEMLLYYAIIVFDVSIIHVCIITSIKDQILVNVQIAQ